MPEGDSGIQCRTRYTILPPLIRYNPLCVAPGVYGWDLFAPDLAAIGRLIVTNRMLVAMHPDQFVVLNSPRPEVVQRSIDELVYHAALLDAMKLPVWAKIQIHVSGAYNDKKIAKQRFSATVAALPRAVTP